MKRLWVISAILLFSGLCLANELKVTDGDRQWAFNQAAFLSLSPETLITSTPWTEGELEFEGLYLSTLLKALNIQTSTIKATALNDYSIDIPVDDAIAARAFIAVKKDGKFMPIRDKGPFWIIFPFSDQVEKEFTDVVNWSIWQMATVETAQ